MPTLDLDRLAEDVAAPRQQRRPARTYVKTAESVLWDYHWRRLEVYDEEGQLVATHHGPAIPAGRRLALLEDRYSKAVAFLRRYSQVGNLLAVVIVSAKYEERDLPPEQWTYEMSYVFRREKPYVEEPALWTTRFGQKLKATITSTLTGGRRLTLLRKR